ncbi:helix-turn-helix domain-containing protein [Chryseobacterium sp. PBS4-4]|uniref:Helix-turn-helix domain-containing protein n=1 Tax=Chryseobacterium edaphi TaxID=2976532 RepID=A0ABT2W6U6_9FLAO|nr:helix-turn-helix domain-containing protein [Chryseobacterium edaphi]MCU7617943.1 helix-turn-helix domain-containing protein [Chryseobacterium edaphi]
MPDYINIYNDLIIDKFPDKLNTREIKNFLSKKEPTHLDIIQINDFIYNSQSPIPSNQRLKCYDKKSILRILKYQKENELSNSFISLKYRLSRNTVAQWKKWFASEV